MSVTITADVRLAPDLSGTAGAVLRGAAEYQARDPECLTPLLVLADALDDDGDPRAAVARTAADLWRACAGLEVPAGAPGWTRAECEAALAPATATVPGWRAAGLWGCLVAYLAPVGGGAAGPGWWAEPAARDCWRGAWWWALGLAETGRDGEWPRGRAAVRRAWAAAQAAAAEQQAGAAANRAWAAGYLAGAAWRRAGAAEHLAAAAGYLAGSAGRLADAADRRVLAFARAAWGLVAAAGPVRG